MILRVTDSRDEMDAAELPLVLQSGNTVMYSGTGVGAPRVLLEAPRMWSAKD